MSVVDVAGQYADAAVLGLICGVVWLAALLLAFHQDRKKEAATRERLRPPRPRVPDSVWLMSTGEYADRCVVGVYGSLESALVANPGEWAWSAMNGWHVGEGDSYATIDEWEVKRLPDLPNHRWQAVSETCGALTLRSGQCSREPRPGSDRCVLHDPVTGPAARHRLPDGSVNIRTLLAEWDDAYNRHAAPMRPTPEEIR